jgi:hypothetical protein
VLGIRGPASFDETLGIRAAAQELTKKPGEQCPPGKTKMNQRAIG